MFRIFNPRQTVLVSVTAETDILGKTKEKNNLIALDWHTPLSFDPMLYAISVGKNRHSLELIREAGVFAINFMSFSHKNQVLECGRKTGLKIDKFKETGLNPVHCNKIDCVRVGEALAHMECEIINEIEVGDHILFIGKVVYSMEHHKGKRLFHLSKDDFTTTED